MKRDTDMRAAAACCVVLLFCSASAAAAPVTRGDVMLTSRGECKKCLVQFRSQTGKLKGALTLKDYNIVWGSAISADARYAVVGCTFLPPNGPFGRVPVKLVFLQLADTSSPKVLGARTLPDVYEPGFGPFCRYAMAPGTGLPGGTPLALKSQVLPGGAGAVLDVYLSILCAPANSTKTCGLLDQALGTSAIQRWSVTHKKSLGPLVNGERAYFPEMKTSCNYASGLSVAVAANGKVYAAYGYHRMSFLSTDFDTVGVFEVRRTLHGGAELVRTWSFKFRSFASVIWKFIPTGPGTGCAVFRDNGGPGFINGVIKVYALSKGQTPSIGGIRTTDTGLNYVDISCWGNATFAVLDVDILQLGSTNRVLKVGKGELAKGETGNVIFSVSDAVPAIAITPITSYD